MNLGSHPTAYVRIPMHHPFYKIENGDDIPIDCHGGVTYLNDTLYLDEQGNEIQGRFMGWDYAHLGDYNLFMAELYEKFPNKPHKKWTTEEILEDVKYVIEQLRNTED